MRKKLLVDQVLSQKFPPDPGTYWNKQAVGLSHRLWIPTYDSNEERETHIALQNTWFSSKKYRQPPGSESKIFLPTNLSRVKAKEKRNTKSTSARSSRKRITGCINRTLQIRVYPNQQQAQILKRWLGLSRFAYNAVVGINKRKRFYSKNCKYGPAMLKWLQPFTLDDKMRLFSHIKASKDSSVEDDKKFQKSAIWGERKFARAVVRLGMLLRGTLSVAPVTITDEAIDEALIAKEEVIKRNCEKTGSVHSLSFRSLKALNQTMAIRAITFSKKKWNQFYVTYLHSPKIYTQNSYKKSKYNVQRDLWPLHFEKKRRNNNWPTPHTINCDSKLTYSRKLNEWTFSWVYEKQKKVRETQADGSVHAVSIDPGIRSPFTWYSPTKGAGKIGHNDIGRIVRTCMRINALHSKKDKLMNSNSKRKKYKAQRLDKVIFRMRRNVKRLQTEILRKTINFLTREFDVVIIPPFEVNDMVNRKTRKITRLSVRKMLCWSHYRFQQRLLSKAEELGITVIIQNEAYTSKTCSWCGNMQSINGKKVYKCDQCKTVMDRDINGARGIFLRALLDGALM